MWLLLQGHRRRWRSSCFKLKVVGDKNKCYITLSEFIQFLKQCAKSSRKRETNTNTKTTGFYDELIVTYEMNVDQRRSLYDGIACCPHTVLSSFTFLFCLAELFGHSKISKSIQDKTNSNSLWLSCTGKKLQKYSVIILCKRIFKNV